MTGENKSRVVALLSIALGVALCAVAALTYKDMGRAEPQAPPPLPRASQAGKPAIPRDKAFTKVYETKVWG